MHPQWPAVHLLHCLLAVAGSLLATAVPVAGFGLVLLAAVSLYLDLNGRAYLLRRLFFRRASQNVVAPPIGPDPAARLILCAHLDAPLTGAAYNPGSIAAFERLRRIWPARTSPQAVVFWSIALLLPPLGARMAGFDPSWLAVLQLPPTMLLIVAAFMLGEIGLSPVSPGANDNASGVAAALRARRLLATAGLERLEVHLLLAGAGESTRQGVRSFIRSHRGELDRKRTWFVDIDSAGQGEPRYVTLEVPVLAQPADPTLTELCAALSEGVDDRAALTLGPASAASAAATFGYPGLALTGRSGDQFVPDGHHRPDDLPGRVTDESVEAVAQLAADLALLLDRDLAREESADASAGEPVNRGRA